MDYETNRQAKEAMTGVKSSEIIKRNGDDTKALLSVFKVDMENKGFDPFDDRRMAVCYNYLYKAKESDKGSFQKDIVKVDNNEVSAGRLVFASRLYTYLNVLGGQMDTEQVDTLVSAMKVKGDDVLGSSDDPLDLVNVKKAMYGEANVSVDSKVAIGLGSMQALLVMLDQGIINEKQLDKLERKVHYRPEKDPLVEKED